MALHAGKDSLLRIFPPEEVTRRVNPVLSFRPELLARLREGIVEACHILGSSFVAHPANGALRARIVSGALSSRVFYQQLLWLIYRKLFLAVAEARGGEAQVHGASLFSEAGCPDLAQARLDEAAAQAAEQALGAIGGDLAPEELGAVYDGLLGLHPVIEIDPWRFGYLGETARAGARGSERKATGAYYTPPELVAELITSALEPVMARAVAVRPDQPRQAVLDLKVIDPACGTGHFLLAAARRMADELVRLDDGDRGRALRDVITHCIHGVDKNPLAAELCRAALWLEADGGAQIQCADALTLDWRQSFAAAMERGGFDVVLTNPPWEKVKLQEQEFFASRRPAIANASHKAERERLIAGLGGETASAADRLLHAEFLEARRAAEAASLYMRKSGRFPLTGNGDVNTYALFAETALSLLRPEGRAGVIVPTGIATDDSTKRFFAAITANRQLVSLYSFYEIRRWFPGTDDRKPFALLTLGRPTAEPAFCFHIGDLYDLADGLRVFTLAASDIELINPNTRTCPLFRSRADAEITKAIYERVPVLIDKRNGANPWGISFLRMFDMSGDSGLFRTAPPRGQGGGRWLPLYEAKMIHHFDHRFGTFAGLPGRPNYAPVARPTAAQLADPAYEPHPWYWVPAEEAHRRIQAAGWPYEWLFGLRSITNAAAERTVIGTAFPVTGAGNSLPLLLPSRAPSARHIAALIGNFSALVLDFHARHKVGGINLNFFIIEQLAVLPPEAYTQQDLDFIVPRVLELSYTSESMRPFARDLGCHGAPFAWDPGRRALLRAELDARYAKLYGLTLDQLHYILDPGPDYPSQTFRVLKENEQKEFGEYRTQRLILHAWHTLNRA
ncbi:MAG TPA: N-6 DNA methylase [Symbiobacteriaceae bacterium]|nr:N-6 DNA methylase [Symbiobacteriaceae bacterium]